MLSVLTTLVETTCWCGLPHAIPSSLMDEARANKKSVYCPLGHTWVIKGETEAAKLKRELANKQAELDRVGAARRDAEVRAAAAEKKTRRLQKRCAAGVCMCCNRTFENLARHMKSKHPEQLEKTK